MSGPLKATDAPLSAHPSPGGQDALAVIEELAELNRACAALDPDYKGPTEAAVQAALSALAARQPGAQEPVRLSNDTVDGELSVASAIDQVLELFPSSGRAALQTLAGLFTHPTVYRYAAPPAQAVDLGQFRQPVQDWLDDAQASMEEHGDYDGVFGYAIEEGTRLLALIDSQAVGNG
ncbi:hypothetical protein [Stenotrophomonas geniculata]